MADVFLSYAREDGPLAQGIAEALSLRGLSVFWDREVVTGREFEDVIEREIGIAKAMVVLWSVHSVSSRWVRAEAAAGADRDILVPACLDDVLPPLRYRISQTADLSRWSPGSSTPAFESFLRDVAATANESHDDSRSSATSTVSGNFEDGVRRELWPRSLLAAALVFAWTGSLSLATTVAFDHGLIGRYGGLFSKAYFGTLMSLFLGAATSGFFGAMCLRRGLAIGVLQGWLWPVVAALLQLLALLALPGLVTAMPVVADAEVLAIFLLCGSVGPSVLTVSAVITVRAIRRDLGNAARRG